MSEKTVRDVLHQIQKNIVVGKSRFNKFGNYHYRSAEDIVDAVKGLLPDGASLKITDDIIMLGDRFYIKATAILLYKDGSEEASGYAREAESQKGMSEGQITGSTSSYARKYALNGLFAIDDSVDADSQDNTQVSPKMPKADDKRKQAEQFVVKFLKDLETTEYNNIPNLEYENEMALQRIKSGYPDLYKAIETAKANKSATI